MFFLLCRHTDDSVFDDFLMISDHFANISEHSPKTCVKVTRMLNVVDIFTSEDMKNMPPKSCMWFCMNFIDGQFSRKHSCLYNNIHYIS